MTNNIRLRPRVKTENVDRFIKRNATLLADVISFTPGMIGVLLYVGGANYIQNKGMIGGLAIIACGMALMQVAKKIYNYFYGGTKNDRH